MGKPRNKASNSAFRGSMKRRCRPAPDPRPMKEGCNWRLIGPAFLTTRSHPIPGGRRKAPAMMRRHILRIHILRTHNSSHPGDQAHNLTIHNEELSRA